jgi:hypothetical protein
VGASGSSAHSCRGQRRPAELGRRSWPVGVEGSNEARQELVVGGAEGVGGGVRSWWSSAEGTGGAR